LPIAGARANAYQYRHRVSLGKEAVMWTARTTAAMRNFVLALTLGLLHGAAAAGPLDGRSFQGVFLERGKTSGDADTIIFKDGRFRSTACDRYGYSDAPYRATVQGDSVHFEAETDSPRYGKLIWKGIVRDGKLDATAIAVRSGKAPVENWVVAGEKK
jgi:hypothetical protein